METVATTTGVRQSFLLLPTQFLERILSGALEDHAGTEGRSQTSALEMILLE